MNEAGRKVRAAAVTQTTLSEGWPIVTEIGLLVLRAKEAEALECQDDSQVIRLQRKAQAAREFLTDWMNELQKAQYPEMESSADSFITVTTE